MRWGVALEMVAGWLLTLPAAAALGALAAWTASRGTAGTVAVAAVLVVLAGVIYRVSRRRPVTAATVNDTHPGTQVMPAPAHAAA